MTTISRNPITGDLEHKNDYRSTTKPIRRKVSIESMVYPLMLEIKAKLSVGDIEAFEIMSDNIELLTKIVEVDGVTDTANVVDILIAEKF